MDQLLSLGNCHEGLTRIHRTLTLYLCVIDHLHCVPVCIEPENIRASAFNITEAYPEVKDLVRRATGHVHVK